MNRDVLIAIRRRLTWLCVGVVAIAVVDALALVPWLIRGGHW